MNKANEDLLRRREIKKEQEVAEEQKVVEYMKKKAVSINDICTLKRNVLQCRCNNSYTHISFNIKYMYLFKLITPNLLIFTIKTVTLGKRSCI